MTVGIIAGSFDVPTKGHKWMFERSSKLFNKLIVAVATNPSKKYMFTSEERRSMVKIVLDSFNVQLYDYVIYQTTDIGKLLLVDFLKRLEKNQKSMNLYKSLTLVRGIRDVKDAEYELKLMDINKHLGSNIETVFLVPPANLRMVSSSFVKEFIGYNNWEERISKYVEPEILSLIENKIKKA